MKRDVNKRSSTSGAIRIISGQYRGRKLPVLNAQGLRPTTDRLKETVFNWLMPYVTDSHCLDMFAGSGSLGLEALSRYASSCTFLEMDKQAANLIKQNIDTLSIDQRFTQVLHGDALQLCRNLSKRFDMVFIDPPFNQQLIPKSIDTLVECELLAVDAIVYIECERQNSLYQVPESWYLLKQKETNTVSSRVYQLTQLT
jgi:16S rRNA (guanine966-N2)-methyltransferase